MFGPNAVRSHHASAWLVLSRQLGSPLLWLAAGGGGGVSLRRRGDRRPDHRSDRRRVRGPGIRQRIPGGTRRGGDALLRFAIRSPPFVTVPRPVWRSRTSFRATSRISRSARRRSRRCPGAQRQRPRVRRVDPHRRVDPCREVPCCGACRLVARGAGVVSVHGHRRARGSGRRGSGRHRAFHPVRADRHRPGRTPPPDRVPAWTHPLFGPPGQGRWPLERDDLRGERRVGAPGH